MQMAHLACTNAARLVRFAASEFRGRVPPFSPWVSWSPQICTLGNRTPLSLGGSHSEHARIAYVVCHNASAATTRRPMSVFARQPSPRRWGMTLALAGGVIAFGSAAIAFYLRRDGLSLSARLMVYKGQFYENKNEFAEAELLYRSAISQTDADPARSKAPGLLYTTLRLANLLCRPEVNKSHDAEHFFRRSMHTLHGLGDDEAMIEISVKLGSIYESVGRRDLALSGFEWAVAKARELVSGQRSSPSAKKMSTAAVENARALLCVALERLAEFRVSGGDGAAAVPLLLEAYGLALGIHGTKSRQAGAMLTSACAAAYLAGEYGMAEEYGRRAYEIASIRASSGDVSLIPSTCYNYGRTLMRLERAPEGHALVRNAVEVATKLGDMEALREIQRGLRGENEPGVDLRAVESTVVAAIAASAEGSVA